MTKIMTASKQMTDGQIENAVNKLRDALRKHRSEISLEAAQQVLGVENLGMILLAPFSKLAEMFSSLIVRTARTNRSRTAQEALGATCRLLCTNQDVVDSMPKSEADEVEIVFFKPDLSNSGGFISNENLEKEFELRGLVPADPISVAAINEADTGFADQFPHGTHWKDADGRWCYAVFHCWNGVREVNVDDDWDDDVEDWDECWWFAGVRK